MGLSKDHEPNLLSRRTQKGIAKIAVRINDLENKAVFLSKCEIEA